MPSCSMEGCKSRHDRSRDVSFHVLPLDPAMRQKWLEVIDRSDGWTPTIYSAVCSKHFEPSMFKAAKKSTHGSRQSSKRRMLKDDAVPLRLGEVASSRKRAHKYCQPFHDLAAHFTRKVLIFQIAEMRRRLTEMPSVSAITPTQT